MFFSLNNAKNGAGVDVINRQPAAITNRVGTALRAGEVLMVDFENQSYDETANLVTGCLGNGITPVTTSALGFAACYLLWPMVLVTNPRTGASGSPAECIISGFSSVWLTNSGAIAATIPTLGRVVTGVRTLDTLNSNALATNRVLFACRGLHTVAVGEELVRGYFCGNDGK